MTKIIAVTLFCLFSAAVFSAAKASTPLELSMKRMSKAYKQLALDLKQPVDASKPDYLALAATMETEAKSARDLVPKKAADLPADQQATMVADYQKSMDQLDAAIYGLSKYLQDGQWDDARRVMDSIKQQMVDGHKKFRKEEKKPVITTTTPSVPSSQPTPTSQP